MLSRAQPDPVRVTFDDYRLAANAGWILLVTVAHHWGWTNWWTATLIWEMRWVGRTRETRC